MTAQLTTRETTAPDVVNKDAPLTNAELDQNLIALQQEDDKVRQEAAQSAIAMAIALG